MIPLTGYTDRLSAAPGERIAFKISSAAAGPYRASLARVVHADPNPTGPGVKVEDLAHRFAIERPSRIQALALGSYARVDAAAALPTIGPLTVVTLIWPTLAAPSEQCAISRWSEADGAGWALSVGPAGVTARIGVPGAAPLTLSTGLAPTLRAWHRIWLVIDPDGGVLRVGQIALAGGERREAHTALPSGARPGAAAPILLGARLAGEAMRALERQARGPAPARRRGGARRSRWRSIRCSRPPGSSRAGTSPAASTASTSPTSGRTGSAGGW